MKRSDLEALELSKEAIDAIMKLHGEDIETHKSKLALAGDEVKAIQKQLDDANVTIDGFKKLDPEAAKKAADEWKAKAEEFQKAAEQSKKDAEVEIEKFKFTKDLESELTATHKVKDASDVLPKLNLEKIQRGEGGVKFIGLDEQIKPLKESKAYLFSDGKEPAKITAGLQTTPVDGPSLATAIGEKLGIKK
jgi:predicted phage tail protein